MMKCMYVCVSKVLHLVPLLAVYQSQWSTHPCSDLPTLILQSNEINTPPFIVQSEIQAIAPILFSSIYMLSLNKMFKNCLIFKSHSIAPSEVGRSVHGFNTTSQAQWGLDQNPPTMGLAILKIFQFYF